MSKKKKGFEELQWKETICNFSQEKQKSICVFTMEGKITRKWKEIYKKPKNKCNLFQCMMWYYGEDWGMKNTKLCNIHEQREKHRGAFDFLKRKKQFIWGAEEKNEEKQTKMFLNHFFFFFPEKKKKKRKSSCCFN